MARLHCCYRYFSLTLYELHADADLMTLSLPSDKLSQINFWSNGDLVIVLK